MSILTFIDRILNRPDLMMRMIRTLGLTDRIAELPDAARVLRRAAVRCETCSAPEECAHWLEDHAAASEAPAYCRNGDLFARMTERIEAEKRVA